MYFNTHVHVFLLESKYNVQKVVLSDIKKNTEFKDLKYSILFDTHMSNTRRPLYLNRVLSIPLPFYFCSKINLEVGNSGV